MKNKLSFLGIPGELVVATLLVFGLWLAGCSNPAGDNSTDTPPKLATAVTVYMQKPSDWQELHAYVWDDSGKEYNGSGSGNLLTDLSNGFYSFHVESAEYGYINVRFNNGSSKSALDVLGVNTDTYFQGAGPFPGDTSRILLRQSSTSTISAPVFKASEITDSTVTLTWDPVPGIDVYILYDEFVIYDDDDNIIPNSEYWHFMGALSSTDRSFYDDNYGEYLEPEFPYKWKLVAVKYKENADMSALASIAPEDLSEDMYAPFYTVVHNFGELKVTTKESSLPAPTGLRVVNTTSTSVELAWNAVSDADYYMVWWEDPEDEEWYYIEEAYDTRYMDDNEEFIKPGSSYRYCVVAHNTRTYSKDSNIVTATTKPATTASISAFGDLKDISRAAAAPNNPAWVRAATNHKASNQIVIEWGLAPGVTKYEVALFASASSATPISGTKKTVSSTYSSVMSVPTTYGAVYVGVKSLNNPNWVKYSNSVSAFPTISMKSAKAAPSGSTKTLTINMTATWKSGVSYKYWVDVQGSDGYRNGFWAYTNTITHTVSKTPKYTVTVTPYVGGVPFYKSYPAANL